jgi:hypothetical protein
MILFIVSWVAAWITHIVVCIKAGAWMLMIAGALIFPVGMAHGVATWLGYSWT